MESAWSRPRTYAHFDMPVGQRFAALAEDPAFVARHSFSPLISFEKASRRYKPASKTVEWKRRPIMFASHRDACILSYYSYLLCKALENAYAEDGNGENIIAYRALGKANYHFSADALRFALANCPCIILAYDVTKFFDTLDHGLLKGRLKNALKVAELPPDWYAVFRHVTKFHHVAQSDLMAHPVFGERLKAKGRCPVATLSELKATSINITANAANQGIPQGTPISSPLANLYLRDFDVEIAAHARELCGFYRRYSDDILFICPEPNAHAAEAHIESTLKKEKLEISAGKTERTLFDPASHGSAQYLGFTLHPSGASIRPGSMSRQWRKMRKAVRKTRATGRQAIADGKASKIYTKRLRRRFMNLQFRNFSTYVRHSAEVLGSKQVLRQVRRLEREFAVLARGFEDDAPSTLTPTSPGPTGGI